MAIREDSVSEKLDLLEWKRRVFALYAGIRAEADPERAWTRWREERADLFARHPQSPRPGLEGLAYFPYDPDWRVLAEVEAAEPERRLIGSSGEEPVAFTRFAVAAFAGLELELYWLDAYGGGLSSRSATRPPEARPTAPAATCSTR